MMAAGFSIAGTAVVQAAEFASPRSLPVGEFQAEIVVTCSVSGLPSVVFRYRNTDPLTREMSFFQVGKQPVRFLMGDAIRSVDELVENGIRTVTVTAEGVASGAEGLPEMTPVSVVVKFRSSDGSPPKADVNVSSKPFSRSEQNCNILPAPIPKK
jgi:hypothetical protein